MKLLQYATNYHVYFFFLTWILSFEKTN